MCEREDYAGSRENVMSVTRTVAAKGYLARIPSTSWHERRVYRVSTSHLKINNTLLSLLLVDSRVACECYCLEARMGLTT